MLLLSSAGKTAINEQTLKICRKARKAKIKIYVKNKIYQNKTKFYLFLKLGTKYNLTRLEPSR